MKNLLPNEWTASTDPIESLKAGAMWTSAINALDGQAIINSSWLIFETQYLKTETGQNSGKVSQLGANSLAKQGNGWFVICSYYYSESDKSTGMISYWNY